MACDIFMVLLLKVKTNQEMLIAQAALRRNEFSCCAKQKRSIPEKGMRILEKFVKKEVKSWLVQGNSRGGLSRVAETI